MPNRINHLAVWVAALVFFLWGYLWFDVLFGTTWLAALGPAAVLVPKNPTLPLYLGGQFVLDLILAYGTAMALTRHPEDQSIGQGVSFAVFMTVVLWGTMSYTQRLWEGRSITLWLIDFFYVLIGFALVAAIVGAWKKKGAA